MPVKKEKVRPQWVLDTMKKLEDFKAAGVEIDSYSKIKSYKQCPANYHKSYIEKRKDKANNVYAIIGGHIHDALEDIYDNEWTDDENRDHLRTGFHNALSEIGKHNSITEASKDENGRWAPGTYILKFMNANVEGNFMRCITHYIETFKKESVKRLNEALVLTQLNGRWFHGYIDAVQEDKNGPGQTLKIIDYKTSTKWRTQAEIDNHAQQLIIYAWALMKMYPNLKVTAVAWNMLKYINIKYLGKTRKKNTLFRRDKIFDKKDGVLTEVYDAFKQKGYDDLDTALILSRAIESNRFPEEIADMFEIWEGYLEYTLTDEVIENTVKDLSSIMDDIACDKEFAHIEIQEGDDMYCVELCNHRYSCDVRRQHLKNKKERKEKKLGVKMDDVF